MRFCTRWWEVPTHRAPVLEALGVPAISFRDAVWPVLGVPGADGAPGDPGALRGFRSQAEYDNASYSAPMNVPHRAVHFPPAMHARIACVAAHALARAAGLLSAALAARRPALLPEPPPNASALPALLSGGEAGAPGEGGALLRCETPQTKRMPPLALPLPLPLARCETPLTKLMPPLASFGAHLPAHPPGHLPGRPRESSAAPRAAASRAAAGQLGTTPTAAQWWYGEDVPGNGKPGWVASTPGAALAFTVRLGAAQRVILGRLRSYSPTWAPVRASLWRLPAAASAASAAASSAAAGVDAGADAAAGRAVLAMARAWRRAFFECYGGPKKVRVRVGVRVRVRVQVRVGVRVGVRARVGVGAGVGGGVGDRARATVGATVSPPPSRSTSAARTSSAVRSVRGAARCRPTKPNPNPNPNPHPHPNPHPNPNRSVRGAARCRPTSPTLTLTLTLTRPT